MQVRHRARAARHTAAYERKAIADLWEHTNENDPLTPAHGIQAAATLVKKLQVAPRSQAQGDTQNGRAPGA